MMFFAFPLVFWIKCSSLERPTVFRHHHGVPLPSIPFSISEMSWWNRSPCLSLTSPRFGGKKSRWEWRKCIFREEGTANNVLRRIYTCQFCCWLARNGRDLAWSRTENCHRVQLTAIWLKLDILARFLIHWVCAVLDRNYGSFLRIASKSLALPDFCVEIFESADETKWIFNRNKRKNNEKIIERDYSETNECSLTIFCSIFMVSASMWAKYFSKLNRVPHGMIFVKAVESPATNAHL